MATQHIVWIALPNGLTDNGATARVSVLVSPRLFGSKRLGDFDFADWPARLDPARASFSIEIGEQIIPARIASKPSSTRWQALFSQDDFVRNPPEDLPSRRFAPVYSSYPVARFHDALKSMHQHAVVAAPLTSALPTADLINAFEPAARSATVRASTAPAGRRIALAESLLHDGVELIRERVGELVDLARSEADARDPSALPEPFAVVPEDDGATNLLAQFTAYHCQARGSAPLGARSSDDDKIDFHQTVAALGEYFGLLASLGLIIELEFDATSLKPATAATPGTVRVLPTFATALDCPTTPFNPRTAYMTDSVRGFATAPRPTAAPEFVGELLNLALPVDPAVGDVKQFSIVQVDVDEAGARLRELVRTNGRDAASPTSTVVAPLRTTGLSVVRAGNARRLLETIAAGRQVFARVVAGEVITLFADDLLRGLRIDIREGAGGPWRSLHDRVGTFTFSDGSTAVFSEEGTAQPHIVQPAPAAGTGFSTLYDPSTPNHISEALVLWSNWSLAVSRPGPHLPQPQPTPDPSIPPTRLGSRFEVPAGALPRLRFGNAYQIRARVVDLAGNGLQARQADTAGDAPVLPGANATHVFRRFEPISSPSIVLRAPRGDGESVDTVVLRDGAENPLSNERHIVPPPTSQFQAELLGRFDDVIGRPDGRGSNHGRVIRANAAITPSAASSTAIEPVQPETVLTVPYLPDPLAAGVTLRDLPGLADGTLMRIDGSGTRLLQLPRLPDNAGNVRSLTLVEFGSTDAWPDVRGFRLKVMPGEGVPAWDAETRELTVLLPPGAIQSVPISCYLPNERALDLMGMWHWIEDHLAGRGGTDLEAYRQLALLGGMVAVTPSREIRLIHAVRQPLFAPEFASGPVVDRIPGSSFSYLRGRANVHAASTSELSLQAQWDDIVDPGPEHPPRRQPRAATLFALPLLGTEHRPTSSAPAEMIPEARFDAAAGSVVLNGPDLMAKREPIKAAIRRAEEKSQRFVEVVARSDPSNGPLREFAQETRDAVRMLGVVGPPLWEQIAEKADEIDPGARFEPNALPHLSNEPEVKSAAGVVTLAAAAVAKAARDADAELQRYRLRHEFGDTRHRLVRYTPVGLSSFRGFYPTAEEKSVTLAGPTVTIAVPSTARPTVPSVRRIVPSFGWRFGPGPTPGSQERRRVGGGLRVFLDRPWYSSGEGELLGVVIGDPAGSGVLAASELVTRWGRDPIVSSSPISLRPTASNFANAIQTHTPASGMVVLGHEVTYDEARDLYACDIAMTGAGLYFPFVRLCLNRFQPNSLEGMLISRSVQTDFAQLLPDRIVRFAPAAGTSDLFDLSVQGETYRSNIWQAGDAVNHETQFKLATQPPQRKTINPAQPLITVTIEERLPGSMDEAGWRPGRGTVSASQQVMVGTDADPQDHLWRGQVRLPTERIPGQFRIVVQEAERHLADHRFVSSVLIPHNPDTDPLPGEEGPGHHDDNNDGPTVEDRTFFPSARRLVYADAIVI